MYKYHYLVKLERMISECTDEGRKEKLVKEFKKVLREIL